MIILGADGKPARPRASEDNPIFRAYRENIRTAWNRSTTHFLDLMARADVEDRIRRLRESCGVTSGRRAHGLFAYVTKDEEE